MEDITSIVETSKYKIIQNKDLSYTFSMVGKHFQGYVEVYQAKDGLELRNNVGSIFHRSLDLKRLNVVVGEFDDLDELDTLISYMCQSQYNYEILKEIYIENGIGGYVSGLSM